MTPERVLFTFHKIREQSEQGNPAAWRALLDFYAPALIRLLEIHAAIPAREASPILLKALAELAADKFARLRSTSRQSEREFLGDLRALLLETAAGSASAKTAASAPAAFELEKITALLEGLPLLHKEMLFFKLAGYTDKTIEGLMRLSPRVAEKAFERLDREYKAARQDEKDCCPWPAAWLPFLKQVRALKAENCTPTHEIVRIHDGQVSWYAKEPVEKHVSGCLHCLDAWMGLREVGFWRRTADPLSPSQIDQLLEAMPLRKPPAKKKSFFARLRS